MRRDFITLTMAYRSCLSESDSIMYLVTRPVLQMDKIDEITAPTMRNWPNNGLMLWHQHVNHLRSNPLTTLLGCYACVNLKQPQKADM